MPQVELYGHILPYGLTNDVWTMSSDGKFNQFNYRLNMISPSVVDILSMICTEGDLSKIASPGNVIISRSAAESMGVHAGETLYIPLVGWEADPNPDKPVTVAGIFEDFARNTMFPPYQYQILVKIDDKYLNQTIGNWDTMNLVKLKDGANAQEYVDLWCENYTELFKKDFGEDDIAEYCMTYMEKDPFHLVSLDNLFFDESLWGGNIEQGTVGQTIILAGIALLIVIIAFINFINFFNALIPARIKSVNISKIFGASRKSLGISFIFEALCLVAVSFIFALLIVPAADSMVLHNLLTSPLAFKQNGITILVMLAILAVMAVAAAFYPAIYVTSVEASLGVKNGFATSAAGRRLRSVLVGFQFTVAIILMVLASVFSLQYRHVRNFDVGFDKENIVYFTGSFTLASHADTFIGYLEKNPDITGVTQSGGVLFGATSSWGNTYKGVDIDMKVTAVRHNFFDVLGVEVVEGSGLKPWQNNKKFSLVVNKFIWDSADMEADTYFGGNIVIGAVDNINTYSAEKGEQALGWFVSDPAQMLCFYVKMRAGADFRKVSDDINSAIQCFAPGDETVELRFLDEQIDRLYGSTKKQATVISLFAIIAIAICLMGVFGILLFETQHRRKEIALRKVAGATDMEIIVMLNKTYTRTLLICFAVAVPITYIVSSRWLEQFANRISLGWWLYAVVLLALLVVTTLLVTFRSYRAATENPVDSLGSE